MASKHDDFRYRPLNSSTDEIRFVRLRSELSPDGLIQCEIEHTQDWASYTCLSYECGASQDQDAILLSGRRFNVRQNLLRFLERARHSYKERKFWIDAICIDQTNIAEKNQQVGLMGRIYSTAQHTIAWLGDGRDDAIGSAFHFLDECEKNGSLDFIDTRLHSDLAYEILYPDAERERSRVLESVSKALREGDESPNFTTSYPAEAVDNLRELSYWGRVWIVQELRLSHSLEIWCGSFKSNADILLRLMIYDTIRADLRQDMLFQLFRPEAKWSIPSPADLAPIGLGSRSVYLNLPLFFYFSTQPLLGRLSNFDR